MKGAFICTLSEEDWEKTRLLGIYGNRFFKEGTSNVLKDTQQLSIIRDLISMREGDLVFFHIRGKQTIHGVYEVRKTPYFDDQERIWDNKVEVFPYRFLFKPHPNYAHIAEYDANIEVHSLYEFIDRGMIQSLVTLENEQNIEARGVRKILVEDAKLIISLLHRDFKFRKNREKLEFAPYNPPSAVKPLKDCLYKVGNIENAIKAVIMYILAYNPSQILNEIENKRELDWKELDFVNEFFIAQTTRKSVDIYARMRDIHVLFEVKTDVADENALRQAVYYRDLLWQRPWINPEKDKIFVVLIGQRFQEKLKQSIERLKKMNNGIHLLQYRPINNGKWADFNYVI